jgi:pentatricopeptide repeat protein
MWTVLRHYEGEEEMRNEVQVEEGPRAAAVDAPTVLAVLGACERAGGGAGALHAAEEVMAHLTSRPVRPDERAEVAEAAFSSLLVLYAEREATEAARGYDAYDGLEGLEGLAVRDALRRVRDAGLLVTHSAEAEVEDFDTWHALLAAAAAKVGDAAVRRRVNVSECVCLLMDMQSAGVAPTAAAYKALVLACLRGGAGAATAERFLEMAAEARVQPDVSTFNTMLACHIRSRDAQGAKRWFRIMQGGGGAAWADVWQPCAPDAYTLSALLACHPPAAQVQQWWADLVDDGCVRADAVAWTAKINALAAAGCGAEEIGRAHV